MEIVYVGPFEGVILVVPGAVVETDAAVVKGEPFAVAGGEWAASLLLQPDNFAPADDEAEATVFELLDLHARLQPAPVPATPADVAPVPEPVAVPAGEPDPVPATPADVAPVPEPVAPGPVPVTPGQGHEAAYPEA